MTQGSVRYVMLLRWVKHFLLPASSGSTGSALLGGISVTLSQTLAPAQVRGKGRGLRSRAHTHTFMEVSTSLSPATLHRALGG